MSWIFDHLGLIIFLGVVYTLWRKMKNFLRRVSEETERRAGQRPSAANRDAGDDDRVRDIQEEIRRKIAERRGGDQRTPGVPAMTGDAPPPLSRSGIPPLDPFGGGQMRKLITQLERRLQPAAPPPLVVERPRVDSAQLERREQRAEQMRVLEESRVLAARRAAQVATTASDAASSERGRLESSRQSLLLELRDPRSLRRAFVLREVLSPPVGLR